MNLVQIFSNFGILQISGNTFIHSFLGVDIPGLKQVIMVRPPSLEHAIVQASGRAGRLTQSGQRAFTLTYILYNAQDCTGLPESIVRFYFAQVLNGTQRASACSKCSD